MKPDFTARLTAMLLDYSVGLKPDELLLISGPPAAKPLMSELFREAAARSAHPVIRVSSGLPLQTMLNMAADDARRYVNPLAIRDGTPIDCLIGIRADEPLQAIAHLPAGGLGNTTAARSPGNELCEPTEFLRCAADGNIRWVVALYPTVHAAEPVGLTLSEFQVLTYRACMLDEDDPARCWQRLGIRQRRLCRQLQQGRRLRIISPNGTDLTLDVADRRWVSGDGRVNLPDGEVFSAPRETSAEGVFAASFPIQRDGRLITEARLEFHRGQVVKASAERGQQELLKLLNRDDGARRVGEIGIGTNPRVGQGTGISLLDEKIKGTCHIGIGASYHETGGENVSSVHQDFIIDLRNGGGLTLDGQSIVDEGAFATLY